MYHAGWGKKEIDILPQGYAMQGYGMWHHRARGKQTPLFARAFFVQDEKKQAFVFCCLDMGYVTHAMREGVCAALRACMGKVFNEAAFVLTCTHTHSGPGGCAHEAMYNIVTPGFVPEHVEKVVEATTAAVIDAWKTAAPTELGLAQARFDDVTPVAWNRSLRAYNRNPDVTLRNETETHLALNRGMQLLSFRRDGELQSLLSLFGVHATCVGNSLLKHDGDNKGYAAAHAEKILQEAGAHDAVAIFAQSTAGDVSPHYHGPGDIARRRKIKGAAEYEYAAQNGRYQSELALTQLEHKDEVSISGNIDAIFTYVDFTDIRADPEFTNGQPDAFTSEPCHGVAFFRGTRVDGPGMPGPLASASNYIAGIVKSRRLNNLEKFPPDEQVYYRRIYAAQGAKAILMESGRKRVLGQPLNKIMVPGFVDPTVGEMKRQARTGALNKSPMVPTVLPLQIVTIGQVAIVCCPGEFTTTAGQRVRDTVMSQLQEKGIQQVLICTYCNDYMGYVTTNEEYQAQCYEGGHTIFGQWTLAAFQTRFVRLAREMLKPVAARQHDQITRPTPVPADELALRSNLGVPR